MEKGNRRIQYLIAASLSVSSATLGVLSAWPTPVIAMFHEADSPISIREDEISWMLALSAPGFITGSLAARYACDGRGRRAAVLESAAPILAGTMLVIFAKATWLLYITRFLWGFGTGMINTVMAIYLAEIADKDIRGSLSVATRFMFNFGNLVMMSMGSFVSYQTLNKTLLILPICYFIACLWMPESPYFYLKEGNVCAARKVLLKLRQSNCDDEGSLSDELEQMRADVKSEMICEGSYRELMTGSRYRKSVIIAAGLKTAQIMTGMITVQQYLGVIVKESRWNIPLSNVFVIFGAVRFFVGIMSSALVDRVGRRPLLFYSFFANGLSLATVGTYFFLLETSQANHETLQHYAYLPFLGILLSNVISTLGYSSVVMVVSAEIFPLNVKTVAATSLSIYGGILSFVVAKSYSILKESAGLCGVFWIFAIVSIVGAIFVHFFQPETKGKTLREIQIMLDVREDSTQSNRVTNGRTDEEMKQILALGDRENSAIKFTK